jgi:hypothetical protein
MSWRSEVAIVSAFVMLGRSRGPVAIAVPSIGECSVGTPPLGPAERRLR